MINYVDKGAGLHDALAKVGHWIRRVDGEWESSDDMVVQAIIDSYVAIDPLVEAKTAKSALVSQKAKNLRDRVTAAIAPGEMASWPIKRAEAEDYAAQGEAAPCPALRAESQARDIPLEQLVAKVNSNAARFMGAEAAIGGADGRHRDAIAALGTVEEVWAYDFSTLYWPAI